MHWRLGPLLSVSGMRWRLQEAVSSGRSFQHWVCALQGTGGSYSLSSLLLTSLPWRKWFCPHNTSAATPSPECVTEPQSDGAGHGWDCDLKPVTWSLRLWATINLCTLAIPGICYGNRKPTIQAETEGEKAWEGREGREREGDSSIFKGVGHRKRINNPHSLDKYTLLGGPGVDPAPYSKQHRYLHYPCTSFLLFYISLCCFCFLSNSRSS